MAATFIPVSASTIFDLGDNTYMTTLKTHANALLNQASSNSVIVSSTFTLTTSIDKLTVFKVSISTLLETLTGLKKNLALNSKALNETVLDQAHLSSALDRELLLSSSTFLQKSIL